ncbi:MAG: Wzz/FepE/Etk N-terminal domain-containing protein [Terriglobales bacterium]
MSENRELTMDDYLAMLRRRLKVILIPTLIAPLAGFMVSHAFPPKYTSQATVLVEGQKVPDSYVQPVITSDFTERVQTLSEEILSPSRLRPMLESLGLAEAETPDQEAKLISNIQQNMQLEPVITSMTAAAQQNPNVKKAKPSASNEPVPGFTVNYIDSKPDRAQKICNALTSMIVDQNLRSRSDVARSTTDFLARQVDEAKHELDDQDAKLAAFKKQYFGELPSDVDNNLRILSSLNSQLDATTQTLSRAEQDKSYTESLLGQQIATWKNTQLSTNPQTLQQELAVLQAQLLQLQARYTDDHPDVIKTKADIAEIQKKLNQINTATAKAEATAADSTKKPSDTDAGDSASASEPPEIHQLRVQIHQYQDVIAQATLDQKRLQTQINTYEARTAMSPTIEEQYKVLTRDNDNAQAFYQTLLAKESSAALGTSMEDQQEGEQMQIVASAGLPASPSFPNRPLFAAAGMALGLGAGLMVAIMLEFSDRAIRTEKDASAIMDLPLLISLPWLGDEQEEITHRRFWGRNGGSGGPKEHEHIGV